MTVTVAYRCGKWRYYGQLEKKMRGLRAVLIRSEEKKFLSWTFGSLGFSALFETILKGIETGTFPKSLLNCFYVWLCIRYCTFHTVLLRIIFIFFSLCLFNILSHYYVNSYLFIICQCQCQLSAFMALWKFFPYLWLLYVRCKTKC